MDAINYHSKRAMQEFHAGMEAANRNASEAHLRLSSLHMAHLNELTSTDRPHDHAGMGSGRR